MMRLPATPATAGVAAISASRLSSMGAVTHPDATYAEVTMRSVRAGPVCAYISVRSILWTIIMIHSESRS